MVRPAGEPRQIPTPSHTKLTPDGLPLYARLPLIRPSVSPVVAALKDGLIEHADLAVLQGIALHLEWISGRCWCSLAQLAEAAVLPLAQTEAAACRLLAAQLVAIGQDRDLPKMWFWRVHPLVAAHGRPGRDERLIWGAWAEALGNGWQRPPADGELSGTRRRRLAELARERELVAGGASPRRRRRTRAVRAGIPCSAAAA